MTIWKYSVHSGSRWTHSMPKGARIIKVGTQGNRPQMWAMVDPGAEQEKRGFSTYGTGYEIPNNPGEYIGTFMVDGGIFVFHVFEN